MSLARRLRWLAVGEIPTPDEWAKLLRAVKDRLDELDAIEAENKALKKKVDAMALKQEMFEHRTTGWQEGFGKTVRDSLQRMDERIAKMLESEDSADFEIKQWIEEMQALRKDVKALQKRLAEVEARRIQPIVIREREGQSDRTPVIPFHVPPYQPIRTWPGSDPLNPPWKITCQTKDEACE